MQENLYSVKQIRAIEQKAIDSVGSASPLMQRAGEAAWRLFKSKWPKARSVGILCGGGNNGGDGYTFALHAYHAGLTVLLYQLPETKLTPLCLEAAKACEKAGLIRHSFDPSSMDLLPVDPMDVWVDALLGIGLKGAPRESAKFAINYLNAQNAPVLAIDIPSGLNADTGCKEGSVVKATVTVTFIGMKTGLATHHALEYAGEVVCHSLDLSSIRRQQLAQGRTISYSELSTRLVRRPRCTHKGELGHVLVIGGDHGMPGAVRLAGEAALRTGAGLVSVLTRPEHVEAVVANRPELMVFGAREWEMFENCLSKATVVVIGPGLGTSEWSQSLLSATLEAKLPMVIDGDALNGLAQTDHYRKNWVLTPHPGEAARLLGCLPHEVQSNRYEAARKIQEKFGGIVVLKGAGTIIQGPKSMCVCNQANPGMATAGMGDVLSGIVGGFMAQFRSASVATQLGVSLHMEAANIATIGGKERGLLASDLLDTLRTVVNPCQPRC